MSVLVWLTLTATAIVSDTCPPHTPQPPAKHTRTLQNSRTRKQQDDKEQDKGEEEEEEDKEEKEKERERREEGRERGREG